MIRRPPRSTQSRSSAASDVYKRQIHMPAQAAEPPLAKDHQAHLLLSLVVCSRILRSSWRHLAPRRSASHQQASARSVRGRADGLRKRIVPGGASGLQIREGPQDGLWWVRLPLSSATPSAHVSQSARRSPRAASRASLGARGNARSGMMTTSEESYLPDLRALWRKNWPKDIPQAPVYPLGERLLSGVGRWCRCREVARPTTVAVARRPGRQRPCRGWPSRPPCPARPPT